MWRIKRCDDCHLAIAGSVVNQTGILSGAAEFCNGLRLTHHPPHTFQVTILQDTRAHWLLTSSPKDQTIKDLSSNYKRIERANQDSRHLPSPLTTVLCDRKQILYYNVNNVVPYTLTLTPRPAGVSCWLLRSFRLSSPIREVRCCRQSACPWEAEICSRLFASSSLISSRLSAARWGCRRKERRTGR